MTARLITGLTVAAGMGLVGTAQAQVFHTDFDTAGGPFVVTVNGFGQNEDISSVGLDDYFAGAGGNFGGDIKPGGGFEFVLPDSNSFEVAGGVGTLTLDATNLDTPNRAFSFWSAGINKQISSLPVGTTLADLNLSAVVSGAGAGAGGVIDLRLFNVGANVGSGATDTLYNVQFDPNSNGGAFATIGGNILNDFTSNDTDPFNPLNPLDLNAPLVLQIQYENGDGGWGRDSGNILNIDSLTFSVPEPASLSLLALGGLAMLRRRA